jgi:hypothetical protein
MMTRHADGLRLVLECDSETAAIWTWNANGLANKIDWLLEAILAVENTPEAILITETHHVNDKRIPELLGYQGVHSGSSTRSAGVAIYVRARRHYTRIELPHAADRMIAVLQDEIVYIAVYAPVNSSEIEMREQFFTNLAANIEHVRSLGHRKIIMGGDINAHIGEEVNSNGRLFY